MATHEAKVAGGAYTAQASPVAPGYVEVTYQNLSHYTKFIVPLIGAALIAFQQVNGHGNATFVFLTILIAVLQAIGTWALPSTAAWYTSLKFWVGVVGTVAQGILAIVGNDGSLANFTANDWVTIALAALSATGTVILPNGPKLKQAVVADPNGVYNVTAPEVVAPQVFESTPSTAPGVDPTLVYPIHPDELDIDDDGNLPAGR